MEARKRASNGQLPLDKGRQLGINLDAIWLEENREAIATYNKLVARDGVFSTGLRGF